MSPKAWKWLAIAFFAWNVGFFGAFQAWRALQWKARVEQSLIRLDQFIVRAHPELMQAAQRPSVDVPAEKQEDKAQEK